MNTDEKHIYTIADIAEELGISKTTVSRAISGKGRLSTETRAKVLDFIQKHDYRPNAVAKSLAQNRTYNIGLVIPGEKNAMGFHFFRECTDGIYEVAAEHDYDVLISVDNEYSLAQMQRIIKNHKVDGVIATRSEIDSPVVSLLQDKGIPFLIIGSASDESVLHVDNNNRDASRDLVTVLIGRGIKKMALLGGPETYYVTHSRLQGFEDACQQARLSKSEQLVFLNADNATKIAGAIDICLKSGVECIICTDDLICNLALMRLRECGLSIPEDMKIACLYDTALLPFMLPPVTGLRFDAVELGRAACRELLNLLEGREAKSQILPDYQMILRESTQ